MVAATVMMPEYAIPTWHVTRILNMRSELDGDIVRFSGVLPLVPAAIEAKDVGETVIPAGEVDEGPLELELSAATEQFWAKTPPVF